jgi:methylisocitrate lyase
MLGATTSAADKRTAFRAALASGQLLRFPGAPNPLSAVLIEEVGFEGVYVSGAVVSADLGLPDVGLTTATEVARRGQEIARVTSLPLLVDADTGFGQPLNLARTIQTFEDSGIAGCHIEDQINPKRCGHLAGKEVVPTDEMVRRITAAVGARRDAGFVICARTDARAIEGVASTVERVRAYVDAGADMVFPEALESEAEYETLRSATDVPILANMTEFGKTPLLDAARLEALGVNVVIYPVTLFRLAMGAIERGLRVLSSSGSQRDVVSEMQTRDRLYELVDYRGYEVFDEGIFTSARPQPQRDEIPTS